MLVLGRPVLGRPVLGRPVAAVLLSSVRRPFATRPAAASPSLSQYRPSKVTPRVTWGIMATRAYPARPRPIPVKTVKRRDQIRGGDPLVGPTKEEFINMGYYATLIPGHFIRPAWWQWPRDLNTCFNFAKAYVKTKARDWLGFYYLKWASKPTLSEPPGFAYSPASAIAAAKTIHTQLNRAMASGDTDALAVVCNEVLAYNLAQQVLRRPKDRRTVWKCEYKGAKLVSQKIQPTKDPVTKKTQYLIQAIVRLYSSQESQTTMLSGPRAQKVVQGSEKQFDGYENFVITGLARQDDSFNVTGGWKAFGIFPDTTPETWAEDEARAKALMGPELEELKRKWNVDSSPK